MTPHDLRHAAHLLVEARHTGRWLPALPSECRPADLATAYAIQRLVFSEIGGTAVAWKVGAKGPDTLPACAAIAKETLRGNNASLPASMFNLIGVEAEIAYRFGRSLPPRTPAYSRGEVLAAIESIHPAIEVSDTRFVAWASQDRPSHVADQLNHGALAVGSEVTEWTRIDPKLQRAILSVNGKTLADTVGGNPAGDPVWLLVWLANEGAVYTGGLRAETLVTTGSLTGVIFVKAPVLIEVDLPALGAVSLTVK